MAGWSCGGSAIAKSWQTMKAFTRGGQSDVLLAGIALIVSSCLQTSPRLLAQTNPGVSKWNCSSSAAAITPCRVWFLSREHYVRLVQTNQKVSQALAKLFAERLQCFGSLIEEVSLKDSKKRLVKFLLDIKPSSGELPLTREEIAQRIGTARETVARYLSQLQRAKLIGIESRRIVILDEPGLKKLIS